jgi:hypothetical protein
MEEEMWFTKSQIRKCEINALAKPNPERLNTDGATGGRGPAEFKEGEQYEEN